MRRARLLIFVLLVASPGVSHAVAQPLDVGARIRINGRVVGSLVALTPSLLTFVRGGDTTQVHRSDIALLEVSQRRYRLVGRIAAHGAIVGGVGMGVLMGLGCGASAGSYFDCSDQAAAAALLGGAAGAAGGALLGALIGMFVWGDEWRAFERGGASMAFATTAAGYGVRVTIPF